MSILFRVISPAFGAVPNIWCLKQNQKLSSQLQQVTRQNYLVLLFLVQQLFFGLELNAPPLSPPISSSAWIISIQLTGLNFDNIPFQEGFLELPSGLGTPPTCYPRTLQCSYHSLYCSDRNCYFAFLGLLSECEPYDGRTTPPFKPFYFQHVALLECCEHLRNIC